MGQWITELYQPAAWYPNLPTHKTLKPVTSRFVFLCLIPLVLLFWVTGSFYYCSDWFNSLFYLWNNWCTTGILHLIVCQFGSCAFFQGVLRPLLANLITLTAKLKLNRCNYISSKIYNIGFRILFLFPQEWIVRLMKMIVPIILVRTESVMMASMSSPVCALQDTQVRSPTKLHSWLTFLVL